MKVTTDERFYRAALRSLEAFKQKIDGQIAEVQAMLCTPQKASNPAGARRMSAAGRRAISQANKRRWAAYRQAKAAEA